MNGITIDFAKSELSKYLKNLEVEANITLGLFEDFNINMELPDKEQDDAIAISVKNKKGYIAGSNERSVLIGVYRFLEEWGIGWIRASRESYPEVCLAQDVEILEKASLRHRIVCIEGACSVENVLDMVDWLPKVGLNGYFIQFTTGYEFYQRWYEHKLSTVKEPEEFSVDKAIMFTDKVIAEIKKRGLVFHRYGHGWNCRAFGMPDNGWTKFDESDIPQSFHDVCALVNGERKCWNGVPLETQLCYSNPLVREKLVEEVIKTCKNQPECDVFQFWLGDAVLNTCECEGCLEDYYSDHYIRLVNDITDKMVEEGIEQKLVFIIYLDSMHPPKKERIKHPEKAIMMFAPITRTYGEVFPEEYKIKDIPEYKTNSFAKPSGVDENLAYIYNWRQIYNGDTIDFDYHLMWDYMLDAGGERIAKVLHTDIKHMKGLGMNGLVSCQIQRNFFPTSVAMTTMARTLWNKDVDFDSVRRKLYADSFGAQAVDELCSYFSTLSDAFDIAAIKLEKTIDNSKMRAAMENCIELMDNFKKTIEKYKNTENEAHRESWEYLELHGDMYSDFARAIIENIDGNIEKSKEYRTRAYDYCFRNEDFLQPVVDGWNFINCIANRIKIGTGKPYKLV